MPTMADRIKQFAEDRKNSGAKRPSGITGRPRTPGTSLPGDPRVDPNKVNKIPSFLRSKTSPLSDQEGQANPDYKSDVVDPNSEEYKADFKAKFLQPAQVTRDVDERAGKELEAEEKRRQRGKASTIITGGRGLINGPRTARRSLLGM